MGDLSIEAVLDWIATHPGWAGLLVFLVSFAESLAFVGVVVPGAMMMIAFGAAISTGYMEFWPTMWWAVAGAIAGDMLSYGLGYYYKDQLGRIWPLSKRPELLEHGIRFFERHGGKSVVLGRFVGPLRAVVPAVAGMLEMPFARFSVANIISALAWAPLYLLPGIVLGVSLELASEVAGRLALLMIVLLVGIYLLDRIVRFAYRRTLPYVDHLMLRLMGWTERHPLVGKLPAAVVDPLHAETRGLSLLAILLVATSIGFAVIARSLWTNDGPGPLSQLVNNLFAGLHNPAGDLIMAYVAHLGSLPVVGAFTLALCIWFGFQRQWKAVTHLLAALILPLLTLTLLRFLPHPTISTPNDLDAAFNAFPVGYISVATSVYVFTAVLLAREIQPRFRLVVYLAVSTLLGSIAIALLYLGRGWPLFLLGGVTLGLVWATLLGIAYRRHITEKPKRPQHLAVAMMSLLIVPWWFPVQTAKSTTTVVEQQPRITISAADWTSQVSRTLPAMRDDMQHRHDHPLNLQWAGTRTAIEQALTSLGWQSAPPVAARAFLQWLNPSPELSAVPILPHVHNGRYESLRWIKPASAQAWYVIRLWPSNYKIKTGVDTVPLWIGNVGYLRLERTSGLSVMRTTTDFASALEVFKDEVLVSSQTHKNAYKGGLISGRIVDGRLLLQTENE